MFSRIYFLDSHASNSHARLRTAPIFPDDENFVSFSLEVQPSSTATTFAQLVENKSKAYTKIIVEKRVNCWIEGTVSVQEKNYYEHVRLTTDNVV